MEKTIGRQDAFLLVGLGCVLSVVLIALAMFYYPGGTPLDLTTENYSLFTNFLGDLGRRPLSLSGHPNRTSPWLFALALFASGSTLALFFIVFPRLFGARGSTFILEWVGSMAGVAAGICIVGVGLLPVNKYWAVHNQLAIWAGVEFTMACVCYLFVMLRTPHYPKRYAIALGLFVVIMMGYLAIYLFGPQLNTPTGQTVQAITQKIVVLASVATVAFESWGSYRVTMNKQGLLDESKLLTLSSNPST